MRGGTRHTGAATASIYHSRLLIVVLVLTAVMAVGASSAEAASVSLTWNAPTTNANGTALTDLAGYRLYLGTTTPACPSSSFHSVSSPTSSPTSGQTVSTRIAALTAGTTYAVRVTAVDTAGNESACSASVSGAARVDFTVAPSGTTSFGSVAVNGTVDRTFTVENTSSASMSVTASVGSPFSIVSGGSGSLSAGASRAVTVRFRPTATGSFAGNVNFTAGGDTISRAVSGSTTTASTASTFALTVTKNGTGSGTVTSSPAGISCGSDCGQSLAAGTRVTLTASPASGSVFAGWGGACSGTAATCSWTIGVATTVTATFNATGSSTPVTPTPSPVQSTPPATPGTPDVTRLATDASGVTFQISWPAASGAASYRYMAGFNDGTAGQQGSVSGLLSLQLRMPYHASGAAGAGFVCIRSVGSTGVLSADQSCNALPVPAASATPTPAPSAPPASAVPSTLPAMPGNPSVTLRGTDGSGATFDLAWGAASGATSYRYIAAFSDGSAGQQGTVTSPSLQLRMPYHRTGQAFGGFVCVRSVNGAGQSADHACSPVPVPGP